MLQREDGQRSISLVINGLGSLAKNKPLQSIDFYMQRTSADFLFHDQTELSALMNLPDTRDFSFWMHS